MNNKTKLVTVSFERSHVFTHRQSAWTAAAGLSCRAPPAPSSLRARRCPFPGSFNKDTNFRKLAQKPILYEHMRKKEKKNCDRGLPDTV